MNTIQTILKEMFMDSELYIFGKGKRGKRILTFLMDYGFRPVAFLDNDTTKYGDDGEIPCLGLDQISTDDRTKIIISPVDNKEIVAQVEKAGLQWIDGNNVLKIYFSYPVKYDENDYYDIRPFNDYESPYADCAYLHENEKEIFADTQREVMGFGLNTERQLELLKKMGGCLPVYNWKRYDSHLDSLGDRYYYGNSMFGKGSADVLHLLMRVIRPKRIIEIGSGFSTSVMLDTNENYFNNTIQIKCIEPYADRLKSRLRSGDNLEINECFLQDMDISYFDWLEEDDFLFIDSSHVGKIGSDVLFYLFEILPRLNKGVYIHFHDMFYPMEYPKEWMINQGRAYNEMYYLRAFLMYNDSFKIQFFGEMLMKEHENKIPEGISDLSGSLWIRKET